MSILDRGALDESPLADLHTIASELSIDGYRRLRRADLIDAIVARQGGAQPALDGEPDADDDDAAPRRRRGRRGGRGRTAGRDDEAATVDVKEGEDDEGEKPEKAPARARRGAGGRAREDVAADGEQDEPADQAEPPRERSDERGARGTRTRAAAPARRGRSPRAAEVEDDQPVEGVVELIANGSGFLRVSPPEPSDDDVYISAAQVKRCELVSGDRISGPRRAPRRSERFPSLVRVDTINGRPADEVAEGARFDDLPASFPSDAFAFAKGDATLQALATLTPFGKGSRVTIAGPARSGKTEIVRALAASLAAIDGLELTVVLAGVRPEEIFEWGKGPVAPTGAVSFGASADVQAQTVERAVEQASRIAARGANAVVLIDTLDGVHPHAARKALAAARNIVDGGSVTVIATAARPFGGETTVVALDQRRAASGDFPAIDPLTSGTLRAELLVAKKGLDAIARAREAALKAT